MKHPILLGLAGLGLSTGLLLLAASTVATAVFGTPQTLKSALRDSGAYPAVAEQVATEASKAVAGESGFGLDKAQIEAAAKVSFSNELIQKDSEQAIDATYDWLEGKTAKPDIKVDLTTYTNAFTKSLGDQAVQKVQTLPVCTIEQLRQLDPNTITISSLPCQPPGINLEDAREQVINQATKSNQLLQNPVVTSDDLAKDSDGKTAVDRASNLPIIYQWSMRGPWIFGALVAVSILAIIALAWKDWKLALRRIAKPLLGTGITIVILSLAIRFLFSYISKPGGLASKLAGGDFKDVILSFLTIIQQAYTGKLLFFGVAYAIIGLLGVLIARRTVDAPLAAVPISTAYTTSDSTTSPSHDETAPTSDAETRHHHGDDNSGTTMNDSPSSDSGSSNSSSSSND